MKRCPFCAEQIQDAAVVCRFCHRDVTSGQFLGAAPTLVQAVQAYPSKGTAAVLSFFVPGTGQMYKGDVGAGVAWFLFTVIGYVLLIVPGMVIHLCCLLDAASSDSRGERESRLKTMAAAQVAHAPMWTPRAKRIAAGLLLVLAMTWLGAAAVFYFTPPSNRASTGRSQLGTQ